jgi:hypothetical protein
MQGTPFRWHLYQDLTIDLQRLCEAPCCVMRCCPRQIIGEMTLLICIIRL